MSSDFERMMNEKMDNASVKDVLPGFDKDAAWAELEPRIAQKKQKPLLAWWTHAAAIVAGIIIGGFTLQLLLNTNNEGAVPAEVVQVQEQQYVAPVVVPADTVYIVKEVEVPAKNNVQPAPQLKSQPKYTQPKPAVATEAIAQQPAEQAIELTPAPVEKKQQQPEQAIAQAKPKKVKPIHLLDIDNEDRTDALYHNDPTASQRSGFALHISTKRLPDNNTQQQSSLLNGILKK